MIQFLNGEDAAFAALEQQATGACVVFSQQLMPLGAIPNRARVAFQISEADRSACLLVDRNIRYAGFNNDVRRWFAEGELRFQSFDLLRQWIQKDLKACYGLVNSPSDAQGEPPEQRTLSAPELTDFGAVLERVPRLPAAVYIDEGELFAQLAARVRGQDEALRFLARVICRHLARRSPRRPATVMALGPTGVGKTASAEWLPHALRSLESPGARYGYLRLDMSEYQEAHRISSLLGAPPGYVGHGDGAQLVNALAANGRTVVLFDEIEKAHHTILSGVMNMLDAGRLSAASAGGSAREIDCRAAVFLFTSNIDCAGVLKEVSERRAFGNREVLEGICRRRLRAAGIAPELVGRIGCFLVFRPLSTETRAEVIALAVVRVAEEYGLNVIKIAPTIVSNILNACPAEGFGARPDEYLVDEVLGECFAETARTGVAGPIVLEGGPPYLCTTVERDQPVN